MNNNDERDGIRGMRLKQESNSLGWRSNRGFFRAKEISANPKQPEKKLTKCLVRAARKIPFYSPYRHLPYSLWPILDDNLLLEYKASFVMKKKFGKGKTAFKVLASEEEQEQLSALSGHPSLNQAEKLSGHSDLNHSAKLSGPPCINQAQRNHIGCRMEAKAKVSSAGIFAYVCQHGQIHFDPNLYYIEPVWLDEKQQRMVPLVTTLTRYDNPLVRYRLDEFLLQKTSVCACEQSAQYGLKWVGHAEDIIYVPHIFNKQLLPLYPDQLEMIMGKFPGIQDYQIVQQSISEWTLNLQTVLLSIDTQALANMLQEQLLGLQMKCPKIVISQHKQLFLQSKKRVLKEFLQQPG